MGIPNQAGFRSASLPLETDPDCLCRTGQNSKDYPIPGNFKKPLVKTVKKWFDEDTTLYGGRKGFTDLMMGHTSIDRAWRHYKSRRHVHHNSLTEKMA